MCERITGLDSQCAPETSKHDELEYEDKLMDLEELEFCELSNGQLEDLCEVCNRARIHDDETECQATDQNYKCLIALKLYKIELIKQYEHGGLYEGDRIDYSEINQ